MVSIDEAIKQLETYTIPCGKYKAAYDLAVETMRKYQRIQAIVNSNPDYIHYTDMDAYKVNSIREVLDNGKNT